MSNFLSLFDSGAFTWAVMVVSLLVVYFLYVWLTRHQENF
jgi:hypothetical protein